TGDGERLNDIVWLRPDATPMEADDWQSMEAEKTLGMYLNGNGIPGRGQRGERIVDNHFLIYCNASEEERELTLPPAEYAEAWDVLIDTGAEEEPAGPLQAGEVGRLAPRSFALLREHVPPVDQDYSVAASIAAGSTSSNGRETTPEPRPSAERPLHASAPKAGQPDQAEPDR
ncbi:MAG TPA: glycogen debranching enzyme, partial [Agrococcus sp.]|nr:glycogen debranching enzyme [Agrococcus sp.]